LRYLFSLPRQFAPRRFRPKVAQTYAMEYYYKAQWGHQQEFLKSFPQNHYPLCKNASIGRRLPFRQNRNARQSHDEDSRWTYRVTITFKNTSLPPIPPKKKP